MKYVQNSNAIEILMHRSYIVRVLI